MSFDTRQIFFVFIQTKCYFLEFTSKNKFTLALFASNDFLRNILTFVFPFFHVFSHLFLVWERKGEEIGDERECVRVKKERQLERARKKKNINPVPKIEILFFSLMTSSKNAPIFNTSLSLSNPMTKQTIKLRTRVD